MSMAINRTLKSFRYSAEYKLIVLLAGLMVTSATFSKEGNK